MRPNLFFRHMVIDADRMDKFIAKVGHEIVKNKKGAKTPADDAEVKDVTEDLKKLLIDTEPKVKQVVSETLTTDALDPRSPHRSKCSPLPMFSCTFDEIDACPLHYRFCFLYIC